MIHKASIVSENGGLGNRQRIAEAWTFAHNSQQEIVRNSEGAFWLLSGHRVSHAELAPSTGIPITNCHNVSRTEAVPNHD